MKQGDIAILESLIDNYTLGQVLNALADICTKKAQAVKDDAKAKGLSSMWEFNARAIDRVELW